MANPAPFPPVAYDTADWVRTVTPVTVSGGTVTPSAPVVATNGGTLTTSISAASNANSLAYTDGLQHSIVGVQLSLIATAFSGVAPWTGRLTVATAAPQIDIAVVTLGIQTISATGQLPQTQNTIVYPSGFLIPIKTAGTAQVVWDFAVDVGSGAFTLEATIGFYGT